MFANEGGGAAPRTGDAPTTTDGPRTDVAPTGTAAPATGDGPTAAAAFPATGVALPMAGERVERRDAAENRRRILEAARTVVARQGTDGVSMEAVAREAGVGKATVFRRFGDRAGLTQALIEEHMGEFQQAFLFGPPPLGPGAAPGERLEAFLVGLVRVHLAHLDLAVAHDVTPGSAAAPIYAALLVHAAILVREVAPDADDRVVAGYLLSAVAPGVLARMRDHFGATPEALEDAARRLVRGIG